MYSHLRTYYSLILISSVFSLFFFFNDTATTEIYTLSLHDALPISTRTSMRRARRAIRSFPMPPSITSRSEEHTSELQSRFDLVCRLLLEKKKKREANNQNKRFATKST